MTLYIQSDTAGMSVIKHCMRIPFIIKIKIAIRNEAVGLYAAAFFIRKSLQSQTQRVHENMNH